VNENLTLHYEQDPKLTQVVDSIYTIAYALDSMYNDYCRDYTGSGLCPQMIPVNGSVLFHEYLLKVNFKDSAGQHIYFDDFGDPPAK
jgi:Receptor family ligand binding region